MVEISIYFKQKQHHKDIVFELNDLNTSSIKEKFRFKNKKVKEIQETIGIHGMLVQNGRKLYLYIYIYIFGE